MEVSCQLHAPVSLLSKERGGKKNSIPSRQETRLAQKQSGYCREQRKITVSAGNLTPVVQLSSP